MKHLHLMILASVALGISKANCQTIPLYCWIVADNRGDSLHTYSSISNSVDELNAIYSQVAMEFRIGSISRTNSTILAGSRYGYAVFSQIIISAHPIDGRAGEW